jgi:hypothetical protein
LGLTENLPNREIAVPASAAAIAGPANKRVEGVGQLFSSL